MGRMVTVIFMTKNKGEDNQEEDGKISLEKTQTFVILNEMGEDGKNRLIYADKISTDKEFSNWLLVEHHKKDGSKCSTRLPITEIKKIYRAQSNE